ncbi:MAG: hypothetical protein KGL43_06820, partial [Burkholderiales bacterium]|nr:hypothetical protein [Burkholderiales bacterium]
PAWRAEGWQGARAFDPAKAAALADRIARIEVDGLAPAASTAPAAPALRLAVTDAQGKTEDWTLEKAGDTYRLQVSGRPWVLQLQPWNAKPLLDACAATALALPAATK